MPLSCRQPTWKQRHSASLSKELPRSSLRCLRATLRAKWSRLSLRLPQLDIEKWLHPCTIRSSLQDFGSGPYIWSFCTHRQGSGETQESKRRDLVKILCTPKAQKEGPMNATLHNKGFAHWLGAICHAQSLYVWVPAHWAPCICTIVKNRTAEFDRKRDHEAILARAWGHEVEQQAQRDGAGIANATVVDGVAYFLRAVDLRPGIEDIPSLVISIRAPWLELPVAEFVNSMQTVYQGVLDGIFCQRPIAAWFSAQCKRIQMTIILPSASSIEVWQNTLLRYTSCWPFRLPQNIVSVRPPSKTTFVRLRKRVQAKHILGGLEINWSLIEKHLWMEGPPMLSRADLENQLFLLRSGSTTSATYKGRDRARWGPWTQRRDTLWWSRTYTPPRLALSMSVWILWGNTNHQSYLDWLAQVEQEQIQTGRFKTKKGYWIVKRSRQI